ncbi:hypothetical protein B484DRAFT_414866 [Ochromonadaceae sp. CCMP2298]|nr:hypothetical protein B484DRAFT_414866 [Ochromonadaceae sp. CCMP2298]
MHYTYTLYLYSILILYTYTLYIYSTVYSIHILYSVLALTSKDSPLPPPHSISPHTPFPTHSLSPHTLYPPPYLFPTYSLYVRYTIRTLHYALHYLTHEQEYAQYAANDLGDRLRQTVTLFLADKRLNSVQDLDHYLGEFLGLEAVRGDMEVFRDELMEYYAHVEEEVGEDGGAAEVKE